MNDKKMTREFDDLIQTIETAGWVPIKLDKGLVKCRGCGANIQSGSDTCGTCGQVVPPSERIGRKGEVASLMVVAGDMAGEVFDLKFEVHIIGRGEEADLVVLDPEISRMHARLKRHENHYIIEDLRSANGTWLNDTLVNDRRLLLPGDRLRIGQTELIVRYLPPET